jgi:hypothetical protein
MFNTSIDTGLDINDVEYEQKYENEIGYSIYKSFRGYTCGRRCKREVLYVASCLSLVGLGFLIISPLEGLDIS